VTAHPGRRDIGRVTATRYRIVVKGRLSETLGSAFDGMEMEAADGRTSLTGTFEDQSMLHGALDRLRNFGIELISINPVDEAER
jgi:hypothetical protein